MTTPSGLHKRQNSTVALLVVVMAGIVIASPFAAAQTTLSEHARQVLELMQKRNSPIAKLTLVADPAQTEKIVESLRLLGGEIRFQDDRVGYVRVIVPMAKVDAVTQMQGVQVVEPYYLEGPEEAARIAGMDAQIANEEEKEAAAAAKVSLPADVPQPPEPYATQNLMGVDKLLRINPNFDGRGVVIAVVDRTPVLEHPELQWARTLDGRRVPKILDVVPTSLPKDGNDPWWVDMHATVETQGETLQFDGKSYRAPREGKFRIGIFTDLLAGKLAAKVHDAQWSPQNQFAVLWDPASNEVWVDTNQNQEFSDETALTDYSKGQKYGLFGPASGALDQKVTFSIYTAPRWSALHIALGKDMHGTMCASTAAGNRESGGLFDGVAPNAQIIAYDGVGGTGYATEYIYTESLIRAVSDPRVDVVSVSLGLFTGIPNIVMARLSQAYQKPISYAALMGSLPPVITTAMYFDSETLRRNLGITGERKEFIVGARFTLPDGRLVPDVVGPVNSLAAGSPSSLDTYTRANTLWLHLPLGYMIGGGSSQSTPMIAGLLAQEISAARQKNIPVDFPRLLIALHTGSRWISEVPGSNKSAPLPQADQIWSALERMKDSPPDDIKVEAPLETFVDPGDKGLGVVDEHGVLKKTHTYRVSLMRQSGSGGEVTYDLRWLGNDGTFTAPGSVVLKKNRPAIIETQASPQAIGTTTAVLEVIDARSQVVVQEIPHSVTVPIAVAGSKPVMERLMIEQHGEREIQVPSLANATIEVDVAATDPELSLTVYSPSNQWLWIDPRVPDPAEIDPQLGHRTRWERLTDLTWSKLPGGVGYRVMLAPDVTGLWELSFRRRDQPDIQMPHTHTAEDMQPAPVVVRMRLVNKKR